jgi:hypothetical protein
MMRLAPLVGSFLFLLLSPSLARAESSGEADDSTRSISAGIELAQYAADRGHEAERRV